MYIVQSDNGYPDARRCHGAVQIDSQVPTVVKDPITLIERLIDKLILMYMDS